MKVSHAGMYDAVMSTIPSPLKLQKWIRDNKENLRPPVSNKQLFTDSADAIVFVSGGPNTRNDFHVNPTEELFYQLKGTIAVRVRPLDGSKPYEVVIKEGDMFLLPRWVPHRPQRPAGTVGLIVEFPRGVDAQGHPQQDALRWYCPACDSLVHEARWVLKKIDEDLKIIMEGFWGGPEERRTCRQCGTVIQRGGAIELKGGKVRAAKGGAQRRAAKKSAPRVSGKKKIAKKVGRGRARAGR
jgi:3-hydroxyanthranilate 3,4-dioxygenase